MASIALSYQARRYLRSVNWFLIVAAGVLTLFGIVVIQSANLHSPDAASEYKKHSFMRSPAPAS